MQFTARDAPTRAAVLAPPPSLPVSPALWLPLSPPSPSAVATGAAVFFTDASIPAVFALAADVSEPVTRGGHEGLPQRRQRAVEVSAAGAAAASRSVIGCSMQEWRKWRRLQHAAAAMVVAVLLRRWRRCFAGGVSSVVDRPVLNGRNSHRRVARRTENLGSKASVCYLCVHR